MVGIENKPLALIKILLRTAEKTREGAKGLVSASQILLEAGPEALLYCLDVIDNAGSVPLHNMARRYSNKNYHHDIQSRMKCIEAFLLGSTIEPLAFAFLFVD